MQRIPPAFAVFLLLAACGGAPQGENVVEVPEPSGPPVAQQVDDGARPLPPQTASAWESAASGEGMSLRLVAPDGKLLLTIGCLGSPPRLAVTAPAFTPIGSEDRFSLGFGAEPIALVADLGRRGGSGVAASGAAPENLPELLEKAGQVSALYGNQRVGPVPAPPPQLKDAFGKSCRAK
jgi:hypothetical protein